MPSSHLILCPLLLLPPISPSIRVFNKESTLRMRWPKYWSFSFSISPSNEHPNDYIIIVWSPLTVFLCFSVSRFSDETYSLAKVFHRQKAGRGYNRGGGGAKTIGPALFLCEGASWESEAGVSAPALLPICPVTLGRSLACSGLHGGGAGPSSRDLGSQTSGRTAMSLGYFYQDHG